MNWFNIIVGGAIGIMFGGIVGLIIFNITRTIAMRTAKKENVIPTEWTRLDLPSPWIQLAEEWQRQSGLHCWHKADHKRIESPEMGEEICCYCGKHREFLTLYFPKEKLSEHGQFYPIKYEDRPDNEKPFQDEQCPKRTPVNYAEMIKK